MTLASPLPKHFLSDRVEHFTESVIREMTRQAIADDVNQYAITWGAKSLRHAIARQMKKWQGLHVDPEREIVVCCGSTNSTCRGATQSSASLCRKSFRLADQEG